MLAAVREEIDWIRTEGVYEVVSMQEGSGAGMRPLDFIWVDRQVCETNTRENSIEVVCVQESTK